MQRNKSRLFYLVYWLFLWMVAVPALASQESCPQKIDLTGKMNVWIDKSATVQYPQVVQEHFEPVKSNFSYGSTRAAVWVKLNLGLPKNCESAAQDWLLRMNVPYHDQIDVYWRDGDGQISHWQGGDHAEAQHYEQTTRLPIIPMALSASDREVFIRFVSQNTLNVSMDVITQEEYQRHEHKMLLVSSFIGALIFIALLLAILNFLLFKSKSFLFYAGFTVSISFIMMFVHGWTSVFWPSAYGDVISTLAQPFAALFLLLLSNDFMKLQRHYKKFFYTLLGVAVFISVWAVFSVLMEQYRWSLPVTHFAALFIMASLLVSAIRLWRKEPLAKIYIAVFSVTLMALIVRLSVVIGFVPINFWTDNSMSLTFTAQVLLFLLMMFIQNFRERTQRLEFELKAKQASEEVEKRRTFMNLLSHELMTPLAILDSSVRNIQEDWAELDEPQQRQLEKQRKSLKRMRQMVDMCLAKNYWEAGQNHGDFAVSVFEEKALQELHELFDINRLNWTGRLEPVCSQAKIAGQPEPLVMVLSLIVHNALKYSKEVCDIELHCNKGSLEVSVRDRGIGFDARVLTPKPFERGENVSDTQGLGLGLTVAHELVQGYGGQLCIQALNPGSLVTFSVPLQK